VELSPERVLGKKLKKVLKKVLTKGRQRDIIIESPRESEGGEKNGH